LADIVSQKLNLFYETRSVIEKYIVDTVQTIELKS